jgi:hypothetical protein
LERELESKRVGWVPERLVVDDETALMQQRIVDSELEWTIRLRGWMDRKEVHHPLPICGIRTWI